MPLSNHSRSTTIDHPHPLRSHRSTEDLLAASEDRLWSPHSSTLGIDRPSRTSGGRSPQPASDGRPTDSLAPFVSLLSEKIPVPAEEGLCDGARAGESGGHVPAMRPVRPVLRPTVSFSEVSQVSYYSADSPILEQKSMRVAMDEVLEQNGTGRWDWRFYGCFTCLCLLNFACDLSVTALSTALPTLSHDLELTPVRAFWIPGSLLLSAALTQPLFMRLSVVLGCKSLLLLGITFFTTGSILAAYSNDLTLLFSARCIEGVGVGGISVLSQLTLSQISRGHGLPADRRRVFLRAALHLFWLGMAVGPIVGGVCVETVGWRNVFWIQIPFGLLGLLALPFLLRLPYVEAGPLTNRLLKVDVFGWLLLSASIASICIAISWGGTSYAWSSYQVLSPLVLGIFYLLLWSFYNKYRIESILPVSIFRNASAAVACFGTFAHGAISAAIIYLMPIFLRTRGLNELVSGLYLAPWTFSLVVSGLLGGAVQYHSGYRWTMWTAWGCGTLGLGLMILIKDITPVSVCAPIGLISGIALGMLLPGQSTAIESAASTDDETIHAAPLHIYLTTLGRCFGVLGGSSIFLNRLKVSMLSKSYLSSNDPNYINDALSMVNVLVDLPSEQSGLRSNLIASYVTALRPVWITACALAGTSFFLSLWFLEDHTPPRRPSLPELE